MKKIIVNLFILISILLLCDRLIVYFFSEKIFQKSISGETGGVINYLLEKKKNTGFLIMGSSRARYQINPALLTSIYNGNGYNAGNSGTGIVYNYLLLNLLTDNAVRPKILILQTDPHEYFVEENENNNIDITSLYPYLDKSNKLRKLVNENSSYREKIKLLFHTYRYNGKMFKALYHFRERNTVGDNNGYEAIPEKMDTTGFVIEKPKLDQYPSKIKIKSLMGLIQTCKANNTRLVVVLPPSYKNSVFFKPASNALVELLHHNNVFDVYDLSDVEKTPSLQPAAVWKNATHLNKEGAAIFSLMLNDSLKQLH